MELILVVIDAPTLYISCIYAEMTKMYWTIACIPLYAVSAPTFPFPFPFPFLVGLLRTKTKANKISLHTARYVPTRRTTRMPKIRLDMMICQPSHLKLALSCAFWRNLSAGVK